MRPLLLIHSLLLVLASTSFTILSVGDGGRSWTWEYFKLSYANGWGRPYVSDYSLPVVATYLAAFVAGGIGYWIARTQGRPQLGTIGLALCVMGAMSFLIEGSHWVVAHHLSCLAFSPPVMLVLAAVGVFSQPRGYSAQVESQPA